MKTFTVINDFDGNDTFEVEAENLNAAQVEALNKLGWWIAGDGEEKEKESLTTQVDTV